MQALIHKIPEIHTSTLGVGIDKSSVLKKYLLNEYKKFIGQKYLNRDLEIYIEFINDSAKKLSYGTKHYKKKTALLLVVDKIIENMIYSNWGSRKISDKQNVIGYFNFKCKVYIDHVPENIRIAIQVRSNGKFYYNHEINIY